MADMIEIKHLNKYFGDLHVLKDINPVSYTHLDVYKRQRQIGCTGLRRP